MNCDDLKDALERLQSCDKTDDGVKVSTHCLYPSFEQVEVFVSKAGDGFRVHDGGAAGSIAWLHGRDERLTQRMLARFAARHHLTLKDQMILGVAQNSDWLPAVILAVANASAAAATAAVERSAAAAERNLGERIYSILCKSYDRKSIAREYEFFGRSGKRHRFDFALVGKHDHLLLIDTVTPHPMSIASKYVAFADAGAAHDGATSRFAVYDRELGHDDISLLQQVAQLVPFKSLEPGVKRAFKN
ncbi:hypothetical protein [Pyruvatibacter mobilis]|uniref:hypothetical protein n=1 Tax=Pyruvatibacter mobilis TaxID=1712261 RepID=UPI003C79935A